ncbi:hypothetical protein D3C79_861140 [compost metagenome]
MELVKAAIDTGTAAADDQGVDTLDVLVHHFAHEGGLLGQPARAEDVRRVEVALPDLPGGRRTIVQIHRGTVAVAEVASVLHRITDLGAEADPGQFDILEITQAIGRRCAGIGALADA